MGLGSVAHDAALDPGKKSLGYTLRSSATKWLCMSTL